MTKHKFPYQLKHRLNSIIFQFVLFIILHHHLFEIFKKITTFQNLTGYMVTFNILVWSQRKYTYSRCGLKHVAQDLDTTQTLLPPHKCMNNSSSNSGRTFAPFQICSTICTAPGVRVLSTNTHRYFQGQFISIWTYPKIQVTCARTLTQPNG